MKIQKLARMAAHEATDGIRTISPLLHGRTPAVQGAILADLMAKWLAGHPRDIREQLLAYQIEAIRALISVNVDILFDGLGHPQDRN